MFLGCFSSFYLHSLVLPLPSGFHWFSYLHTLVLHWPLQLCKHHQLLMGKAGTESHIHTVCTHIPNRASGISELPLKFLFLYFYISCCKTSTQECS